MKVSRTGIFHMIGHVGNVKTKYDPVYRKLAGKYNVLIEVLNYDEYSH